MTEQIGKITLNLDHYVGQDFYCDGAVEDELLQIARDCAEVEFPRIIEEKGSWPVLYHLSPLRENIVSWIPMTRSDKVLEIGSGCGAITGALARKAGTVTCVDLSKKRSSINAYRHSDCENVTIHVGNFNDIEPDLPCDFDYICLIGVFEYGQSYIPTEKPYETFLNIIRKHLAPGGRIIIAIENKLGLKYFAGCKEDHLGTYFSGIENYEKGDGVRTFSRPGLEKIFEACGVKEYHFYYPYPDYKFMTTVYSDEYLPKKGELNDNLRNFDRERMLLFDEGAAFDGITEDRLFSVFSNSYEVVIGPAFDVKYARFSNDRADEYKTGTEILIKPDGTKTVEKHPLCNTSADHISNLMKAYEVLSERYAGSELRINRCELRNEGDMPCVSFEFVKGRPLSELFDELLERGDEEGFFKLLDKFVERIGYGEDYPATDYDLIFDNIMVDGDTWTVLDYEWTFAKSIPTAEIAFRAVYCYLIQNEKRNKLSYDLILEKLGISLEEADDYRARELEFQKMVTGRRRSMKEIRELIGNRISEPVRWLDRIKESAHVFEVQIYEDLGNDFSEENSYFVKNAYLDEQEVELNLSVSGNVHILRIDPAMESCMVQIHEMTFNGVAVPLSDKKTFYANGKVLKGTGSVVLPGDDPNLFIKVENLDRKAENILYVKMTVVRLPKQMAEDMAGAVKKLF